MDLFGTTVFGWIKMNDKMRALLESKRRERGRLAALPFSGKIPLLEKLRDRALTIGGSALYQSRGSHAGKALILRETDPANKPEEHDNRRSWLGLRMANHSSIGQPLEVADYRCSCQTIVDNV